MQGQVKPREWEETWKAMLVVVFISDVAGSGSSKCGSIRTRGDLQQLVVEKRKGQWAGSKFGADDCWRDVRV